MEAESCSEDANAVGDHSDDRTFRGTVMNRQSRNSTTRLEKRRRISAGPAIGGAAVPTPLV
jgi:hypothetical protein